jgi:hypothetical protein
MLRAIGLKQFNRQVFMVCIIFNLFLMEEMIEDILIDELIID